MIYLNAEEIDALVDNEYYWIAYQLPKDDDETWVIGKYCKKYNQFNLCDKTAIMPNYVIEVHVVEHPA